MMTTFDFGSGPVPAHRHKNPDGSEGGWIADTARVSDTATVSGNAWVSDTAWVSGNATVSDTATVSGNAWVSGNATVSDTAWVSDTVWVSDNAWVSGNATVSDNAWVSDTAWVSGNATVSGTARVSGGHWTESPPQLQCGRWTACLSAPGIVTAWCHTHTLDEWDTMLDDIAAQHSATDYEVALVRAFLVIAADVDAAGIGRQP